jgi:hypothetical protein
MAASNSVTDDMQLSEPRDAKSVSPDEKVAKIINHVDERLAAVGELYLDESTSDVVFIVDSERFPAHKCILITASPYFK